MCEKKFTKQDEGKPCFDMISSLSKEMGLVNEIMLHGAKKYGKDNWKLAKTKEDMDRYKSAVIRHIMSSFQGEILDKDSGLNHLAHAITGLLFVLHLEKTENNCGVSDLSLDRLGEFYEKDKCPL